MLCSLSAGLSRPLFPMTLRALPVRLPRVLTANIILITSNSIISSLHHIPLHRHLRRRRLAIIDRLATQDVPAMARLMVALASSRSSAGHPPPGPGHRIMMRIPGTRASSGF